MAKRLALFNHKGGVSKTTSAYNIGWKLAELGYKVLLVDADPQCNLSSLILQEEFEPYYLNDATKHQNIKDGVASAFLGKPVPIVAVECVSPRRNDNLFLLAGHANLSEYDATLTFAQVGQSALATLQNLPGAFNCLIELTEQKYQIDYTIIDLNPSLSAINQNLFLNSDAFLVPTNPDPFSIMAMKTLVSILPKWSKWKSDSQPYFIDSAYPMRSTTPKFAGGLIQRFNIRNGKAAKPYRDNINEIKTIFGTELFDAFNKVGMCFAIDKYPEPLVSENYCFKEVPDFQGLLPKAYDAGVPVFALKDEELNASGTVKEGLQEKRTLFNTYFKEIAEKLVEVMRNV